MIKFKEKKNFQFLIFSGWGVGGGGGVKLVSCTVFHSKQELLGQFSSTVEQKLYHWEWRNNDGMINLKFKSKETNKIRGKK